MVITYIAMEHSCQLPEMAVTLGTIPSLFKQSHFFLSSSFSPYIDMSFNLTSLLGTIGSWLGGVASLLLALTIASLLAKDRDHFFPPPALIL